MMQLLRVKALGRCDYEATWQLMKSLTAERSKDFVDELWLLEHNPVFTLGQAGKAEHILMPSQIPIVNSDRGGQVTYHGPGQLIAYLMFDIRRLGINVRALVSGIESSVVKLLASYNIDANADPKAPGVYVGGKKIAALGLRVRRGCSYHGLSLNIEMDAKPFQYINPCGYPGLEVVQMRELGITDSTDEIAKKLTDHIASTFGYDVFNSEPS